LPWRHGQTPADITQHSDQTTFEQSPFNVLAQGQAWFAGPEKLRQLEVMEMMQKCVAAMPQTAVALPAVSEPDAQGNDARGG
jgi:hypothetical protein